MASTVYGVVFWTWTGTPLINYWPNAGRGSALPTILPELSVQKLGEVAVAMLNLTQRPPLTTLTLKNDVEVVLSPGSLGVVGVVHTLSMIERVLRPDAPQMMSTAGQRLSTNLKPIGSAASQSPGAPQCTSEAALIAVWVRFVLHNNLMPAAGLPSQINSASDHPILGAPMMNLPLPTARQYVPISSVIGPLVEEDARARDESNFKSDNILADSEAGAATAEFPTVPDSHDNLLSVLALVRNVMELGGGLAVETKNLNFSRTGRHVSVLGLSQTDKVTEPLSPIPRSGESSNLDSGTGLSISHTRKTESFWTHCSPTPTPEVTVVHQLVYQMVLRHWREWRAFELNGNIFVMELIDGLGKKVTAMCFPACWMTAAMHDAPPVSTVVFTVISPDVVMPLRPFSQNAPEYRTVSLPVETMSKMMPESVSMTSEASPAASISSTVDEANHLTAKSELEAAWRESGVQNDAAGDAFASFIAPVCYAIRRVVNGKRYPMSVETISQNDQRELSYSSTEDTRGGDNSQVSVTSSILLNPLMPPVTTNQSPGGLSPKSRQHRNSEAQSSSSSGRNGSWDKERGGLVQVQPPAEVDPGMTS